MSTKATAALLVDVGEPLALEEVELAAPEAGEVRVKLAGAGICHTDLTAQEGLVPLPLPAVLGHEGSGVVEAVGEGVEGLAEGDHVVLTYGHCRECDTCRAGRYAYCELFAPLNYFGVRLDGTTTMSKDDEDVHGCFFSQSSFATHAIAGATNCVKVDADLPLELLGPLGCGLQTGAATVKNVLKTKPGDSVLVIGLGAVGLSGIMAAKALGAEVIIAMDLVEARLELAKELGATHTINPATTKDVEWAVQEAAAPGVHGVLEAVGREDTIALSVKALRSPGIAATVGFGGLEHPVTIDQGHLLLGRALIGVIEGDGDPQQDIPWLLELHRKGEFPFEKLIRRYAFEDINQAIADSAEGRTVKPVIVFD